MKKQLLFLAVATFLSLTSVSCNASPPFTEVGIYESSIKQTVAVTPQVELTVTQVMAPLSVNEIYMLENYSITKAKRQPIVQSVCSTDAPMNGVDGRAVLAWCIKDYYYKKSIKYSFCYIEGIATEYSVIKV